MCGNSLFAKPTTPKGSSHENLCLITHNTPRELAFAPKAASRPQGSPRSLMRGPLVFGDEADERT